MMVRRVWVALALVLGVLDLRLASAEIPGLNKTGLLSVLARDWSGAGLDDKANDRGDIALSNGNAPSYLFKPGDFTYDACLPVAGRPSRCPVDMLSLVLINEPPEDERYTDGKRFNMTLRLHGDIYVSSPNSEGYFGMPKSGCSYERNHTTSVLFNLTTGRVDFTIQETVSDKIVCDMLSGKTMIQRCVGTCHPSLKGKVVTGMFDLTPAGGPTGADDPPAADFKLRMTLAIPYKVFGNGGYGDFATYTSAAYAAASYSTPVVIAEHGTISSQQIFSYTLASPAPWRPKKWFDDRTATIISTYPPFGPEEGGTTITVVGRNFPMSDASNTVNGSIVLQHEGPGGDMRECCETHRLSETEITCRLPRVSCLSNNPANPCPTPGKTFTKQTVSLGIRPEASNYNGLTTASELDDFVEYEGVWELVDEDVYGGIYVQPGERVPGEQHILDASQTQASAGCCPVCTTDRADRTDCHLTITKSSTGAYRVTIPELLTPGNKDRTGVCDKATDSLSANANTSLLMGIERSTDPKGFTPKNPLSVTSCVDQTGSCLTQPRISLRETCKQLVWSTGVIESKQVPGTTTETHEWMSNGKCDRRMRCISGKCAWTKLAERGPTVGGGAVFERRTSSPQVGMAVDYKNPDFDLQGFFSQLAKLIGVTRETVAPERLQILSFTTSASIKESLLGTTFAVRDFELSEAALCVPESEAVPCSQFSLIIYIVSDAEGTPDPDRATVALSTLTGRASAPTGDPEFRMLNIMNLCVDLTINPADNFQELKTQCYKIQYPGVLAFDPAHVRLKVKEEIWAYAKLGVTRLGGSDLGVTVDYITIVPNGTTTEMINGTIRAYSAAQGLGQDFFSKRGQLRWHAGDAKTKFIVVPIMDDHIMELSEAFQVRISDVVNASMVNSSMTNGTQTATVVIVGINNTPQPTFIARMTTIIGIVCGAATIIPCALFAARIVRQFRRDIHNKHSSHADEVADVAIVPAGIGGAPADDSSKPQKKH